MEDPLVLECYKTMVDVEVKSRGTTQMEKVSLLMEALNARERGDSTKPYPENVFDDYYDVQALSGFMLYPAWVNFKMMKRGKSAVIARFIIMPLELLWKLEVMIKDYEKRLSMAGDKRTRFIMYIKQLSFKANHTIYRELFESLVEQGVPTNQIDGGNYLSIPIAIKWNAKSIHLKPGLRLTGQGGNYSCNLEFTIGNLVEIETFPFPYIIDDSLDHSVDYGNEEWIRGIGKKLQPVFSEIQKQIVMWANYRGIELPESFHKMLDVKIVMKNRFPIPE